MTARLVEELAASGDLAPAWRDAFLAVPRKRFVPDTVWIQDGDRLLPLRRDDDEAAWLDLCHANAFVITQVDDGNPAGPGQAGRDITSSASRPDVVARMLAVLDAEPGMRVLEIGTGTGWNAALLAERLGAANITTVEIDPRVAEHARRRLRAAGYPVTTVVGDGALGHPPAAPYDRVIATVAAGPVPYAWAQQTRAGGRVVVPWCTDLHNGALVSFRVSGDGAMRGRIVGNVAFMRLRDQRGARAEPPRDTSGARRSSTDLHPYEMFGEYDASLALGLRLPRCKLIVEPQKEGAYAVWLLDPWSRSWAVLRYAPGVVTTYPVRQQGPRSLWDEAQAAHQWWNALGRPTADRWGLTVTPTTQIIWLDDESHPIGTVSTRR